MCPVPIKLVRVKTNVQYTTFLDRDAITQLQRCLTWKDVKYGRQDPSKPLFVTKRNMPIHLAWVSRHFSEMAIRAGIQKKIFHRIYKIRAHEVRDILKSTLITSKCAQYAADYVLGHAPRDSYEKQVTLYPEELRAEYVGAPSRLNIFSKVESTLNTAEDPESVRTSMVEVKAEMPSLKQSKTETGMTEGKYKDAFEEMHKEMKRMALILDSLHDDIKEKISDRIEDSDGTD